MGKYSPKYASTRKKKVKKNKPSFLFLVLLVIVIIVISVLFFVDRGNNEEYDNQSTVSSTHEIEAVMTTESSSEVQNEILPTTPTVISVDSTLVMNAAYTTLTSAEFGSTDFARYCLYDVNGDSVDELIIVAGTCEADAQLLLYEYSDGMFASVGVCGGSHVSICGKTTGAGITVHNGHMGYETIKDVNIVKGEMLVTILAEDREAMEGYTEFDYCIPLEYYSLDDYSVLGVANNDTVIESYPELPQETTHTGYNIISIDIPIIGSSLPDELEHGRLTDVRYQQTHNMKFWGTDAMFSPIFTGYEVFYYSPNYHYSIVGRDDIIVACVQGAITTTNLRNTYQLLTNVSDLFGLIDYEPRVEFYSDSRAYLVWDTENAIVAISVIMLGDDWKSSTPEAYCIYQK